MWAPKSGMARKNSTRGWCEGRADDPSPGARHHPLVAGPTPGAQPVSTAYVIWDRINCPTRDFIAAQLGAAENAGTLTSEEAIGERCKQRAVQLSELRQ